MKYLHDNDFTVLTMANLAFDDKDNQVYINRFKGEEVSGSIGGIDNLNPSQIQTFSGH